MGHAAFLSADADEIVPQTVRFAGPQGVTLVGYLFQPAADASVGRPAIVMMHGRAGAYSTAANGVYEASTVSRRHRAWGRLWAERGYVALLVDGFGPRGFPGGFPFHSYAGRPEAVNEVTVRPFDAYAALTYLSERGDVDPTRIGLQGWSNGGSATLAAMAETDAGNGSAPKAAAFVGALAFYPACGLHDRFAAGYRVYAPVRVFIGDADEEVSFRRCSELVETSHRDGSDIAIAIYPGATHGFDDPGQRRQSILANARAAEVARDAAISFMEDRFARK